MPRIKDIPKIDRPREKALFYGLNSLSNAELLALIISSGTKNNSALDVAYNLLSSFQGVSKLIKANINELVKINGISNAKALKLKAGFLLYERSLMEQAINDSSIIGIKSIAKLFRQKLQSMKQEKAFIVLVDKKDKVIGIRELFVGTKTKLIISPQIVINEVLKEGNRFYLIHNHPSNNSFPSQEDRITTSQIEILGYENNVELVDHLIITKDNFFSLNENQSYEYNV